MPASRLIILGVAAAAAGGAGYVAKNMAVPVPQIIEAGPQQPAIALQDVLVCEADYRASSAEAFRPIAFCYIGQCYSRYLVPIVGAKIAAKQNHPGAANRFVYARGKMTKLPSSLYVHFKYIVVVE